MVTGQPLTQPTAKASASTATTSAVVKNKENPYTNLEIGKCYRCGEPEHKSNECPKRRQVNIADYEEEEVQIETEPEDSDFVKENGDPVACVVQKILCSQKIPDTTQRHQILYSKCSVKDKRCNLIIDNRSCENIVSRALVDHLKLKTKPHHHPYDIGWIKKGPCIKATNLCYFPISIGKFYQNSTTCDVIDMDKCQSF